MAFSKDQQTSHHAGGCNDDKTIARFLASAYTNAQLALALSLRPDELVRILALPTPT